MAGQSILALADPNTAVPRALAGNTSGQPVIALLAGENQTLNRLMVCPYYTYNNITSATTTTVRSGAGVLHSITVNTTAAGAITIYDNTAASGTKIGTLKSSVAENTYTFDVAFGTGLTIVTAAASDITVSYTY